MALALDPETRRRLVDRELWRGDEPGHDRLDEVARYLEHSSGRLAHSLALIERLRRDGRLATPVLELGSEPWLFTQLLFERGIAVTAASFHPDEDLDADQVTLIWNGRRHVAERHLFDAERDRWPFAEGAFGTVLCMELLEHLTVSPAHMLYEANRVLAPGGTLLLTTPNALAAPKLVALLRGRSVHWAYSGHGPHGRHNREFTPDEVRLVLGEANFDADVTTANLAGYEASDRLARGLQRLSALPLRRTARRRDHIFALGRKAGPPRLSFPPSLYRSYDRDILRRLGTPLPDEDQPATSASRP
jgi:SAM-dependent methyltransferase